MFDPARRYGRRGLALAALAAAAVLLSSPAEARGYGYHGGYGWHGGWGVSVGVYPGWGYYGPYGYGYPYYPYYADPPMTVIQQAPVVQAAPAPQAQAAPTVYYYCDNPGGYYPYVQNCSQPWRTVPITPQAAPPQQ